MTTRNPTATASVGSHPEQPDPRFPLRRARDALHEANHPAVLLGGAELLAQRFLWRGDQTRLHDLQTAPGPNRIAEKLDGLNAYQVFPRLGTLADDLRRLFTS